MEGPGRSKVGSRSPRTHKRMRTTVGHRGGRKSTVGVFRLCASAGKKRDKKKIVGGEASGQKLRSVRLVISGPPLG